MTKLKRYTGEWINTECKNDIIIYAISRKEADNIIEAAHQLIEWDYGSEGFEYDPIRGKKFDEDRLQEFGWDHKRNELWMKNAGREFIRTIR